MPTRRGYRGRGRGRGRSSESSEGGNIIGSKIKGAAEAGIKAYLKGTQSLADAIESKLPESVRGSSRSDGRRGQGGGRRGGGRRGR